MALESLGYRESSDQRGGKSRIVGQLKLLQHIRGEIASIHCILRKGVIARNRPPIGGGHKHGRDMLFQLMPGFLLQVIVKGINSTRKSRSIMFLLVERLEFKVRRFAQLRFLLQIALGGSQRSGVGLGRIE